MLLVAWCVAVPAAADTVNRIAAIVNDDVITEADITGHVEALLDEPDAAMPSGHDKQTMREAVLQRLIEQQLILQEAKRLNLAVTTTEVAEQLDRMRGRFNSDEEFEASLRESNLSQERVKERIREHLLVQHAIDAKVRATISVSPQDVAREVAAHPEAVTGGGRLRARHILVRLGEQRSDAEAAALIQELTQRLQRGEKFAALAQHYSEDATAEDGGDMGSVAPGSLLPELDAALTQLHPGQVSPPIKTKLGYHLLTVEARASGNDAEGSTPRATVYQALYQQKFSEAMRRWLTELTRQAYIEILPPPSGS